ncbi:MAG TPA: DUF4124 domain-containing protein [Sulfuricella sp.]|nr:DUF4124 domain-containing protein [Sulfuricella sp.]
MRYIVSLLMLTLLSFPAAAKMYKWVDENGKTHFGDTIPPQYANQGNVELSKEGLVIKKTDAALTPEQRKAREDEQARKKEEERKKEEQQRRDRALLNTYTTEKEIDLVRDRNLQQGTLQIQGTELRIKQVQPRLDESRKKAGTFTARNKPVPAYLQQEVQETEKEMQHLQEMVKQRRQEMEAIRARFEDDKKRFRELHQIENGTMK